MKTIQSIILIFISFSVYGQSINNMKPHVEVNTNMGSFIIELDKGRAPITVNNFIRYVEEDFYSGTIFKNKGYAEKNKT